MSARQADTSGDIPIRLDVAHQDSVHLHEPPSSVLLWAAFAFHPEHNATVITLKIEVLRILNS
jgi:hypothetical protein